MGDAPYRVTVYLSRKELREIQRRAKKEKNSASGYCKELIQNHLSEEIKEK